MTDAATTLALVKRYYDACNAQDVDAMIACVADDVIHDVNQGERRVGKDRFHAYCARMMHHYRERLDDIVIMVSDDGKRAAAEFNVRGEYLETEPGLPPASGQQYAVPGGAFFAIDGSAIARITTYYNLTEWIVQITGDVT